LACSSQKIKKHHFQPSKSPPKCMINRGQTTLLSHKSTIMILHPQMCQVSIIFQVSVSTEYLYFMD
jgi:hypothetical protein